MKKKEKEGDKEDDFSLSFIIILILGTTVNPTFNKLLGVDVAV